MIIKSKRIKRFLYNLGFEFSVLNTKELLNTPKANHGSIGLKTINSLFDENKLNFLMNSKTERAGELRGKAYWVISKL